MRPAPSTPKAGVLLPPSNFPAGGFGDSRSPRRVSLPSAAPTHASPPAHEAAESPAAAHPGGRGVTCPHRPAGAGSTAAGRGGAAGLNPGRAADPAPLAPDLAAAVAIGLFVATLILWLDALAGAGGV